MILKKGSGRISGREKKILFPLRKRYQENGRANVARP